MFQLGRILVLYSKFEIEILPTFCHNFFFNVSSENIVVHQKNISLLMIFFILTTCKFEILLIL